MKLLVFDGNSIMNRAFYGIRSLSTKDGVFTNAIYGFVNIMNREIEHEKPDYIAVAFDLRAPTFRHKEYDGYKAKRKGMPDELAMQMPYIKEILKLKGITYLETEGYEADDIIGTLAAKCESKNCDCVIITGDRDDLQLVSGNVTCKLTVTKGGSNETVAYTPEIFYEKYGFEPIKLIDLKALWGDSSDNIPGVAKIGEKTATELVTRFGTVEEIYEKLDTLDIKDSLRARLAEGRDSAFMSKHLATIVRDMPLETEPENLVFAEPDYCKLLDLYTKLELRTFAEKIRSLATEGKALERKTCKATEVGSAFELLTLFPEASHLALNYKNDCLYISDGNECCFISAENMGGDFEGAMDALYSGSADFIVNDVKSLMKKCGTLSIDKIYFDTMPAAYLINPAASSYSLEGLFSEYMGDSPADDATETLLLYTLSEKLSEKLDELEMTNLYREIELPLSFVLGKMEDRGFLADREALERYGQSLDGEIRGLTKSIFDMSGEEFNINSPKQLGEILFDKLGLPNGKKGKNGAYKTDADRLEKLARSYPIVGLVLKYRQLSKLKSTYADGLVKVIDERDGRIHSTFNQTVTITGRISSTEPNLQNIPVRTELGRELRKMFVAPEGCVLVDADYSQIELRVLAHMAGDSAMIEAFNSGEDIHAITASQVFGLPLDMVTPEIRSRAKAVNFGIVYGISAFGLADNIGVSNREAKEYIEAYFRKYRGIKEYLDRLVANAKEDGFVTTAFGRRRYLPELKSSNFMVRSFGERAAMNTPIQGTAADIIKLAMVRVENALSKKKLKARLILQIHDELIVECPKEETDIVSKLVVEEMQNAYEMSVPLIADVGVGKSWYDAK